MDRTIQGWNERRWERCRLRMSTAAQTGQESVLSVCEELLSEWSCAGEQLHGLLEFAVARGELEPALPGLWRARLMAFRRSSSGPCPARPTDPRSLCDGSLPQQLHPYVEAIARFGRKQGWAAAELGAQLCDAQRVCLEAKYRFADFLLYIKREYGLSRGSCYLYMKYHEWGLPKELGSAVMKWIVQGFRKGSPEAQMVIEAAVGEGLTLAVLSQRFGVLRDRVVVDSSGGNAERNARIIARLTQEEQRLRTRQKVIEQRLSEVDRRIRQLRTEFTQRPPEESDFPRENMN